jgi:hypothetical protein
MSARRTPVSVAVGFGSTAAIALALYARNYVGGGFGSGVPRPSFVDWVVGTIRSIPTLLLPSIGGGPVPTVHLVLSRSDGDFLQPQLLVPLLIGIALGIFAFTIRHLRPLMAVIAIFAVFQSATIVFARWELVGAGVVSELRYAADFAPLYVLGLASLWLAVLAPVSGQRDARHASLAIALAAALITTIFTGWTYIGGFAGSDRADYVAAAENAVNSVPASALLLPGPVPPSLGWLPTPFDNTRSVLYPAIGDARWNIGTTPALVVDAMGRLVPSQMRDETTIRSRGGTCSGALAATTPVAAKPVLRTAVVTVSARRAGPATLTFAGAPVTWVFPAGRSTVVFQTYGRVGPLAASSGTCLLSSRAFVAGPPSSWGWPAQLPRAW